MRAVILCILLSLVAVGTILLGRGSLSTAAAAAFLGLLFAAKPVHADAYFVAVEQRNSTDTGWITRQLTNPDLGADGIMFFNGTTKLPGYLVLGAGLTISSGVLAANVPGQVNADWNATSGVARILNKPSLAAVATSGAYADLSGRPALATVATTGAYADLTGKPSIPAAQVNADWLASSGVAQVLNKPSLATVATTGAYADLSGRPTIPAAQVNSDWNAATGVAQILNRPTLAAVATSGAYADLSGRPALAAVATSGAYADLTGKPSIPTGFYGSPTTRSLNLATAYQCTTPALSCAVTITLQSQSSISLSGASNNEGAITIGSTNAVASGTGTNVATYKNNLGGTLVVGLNLTSQQANTYSVFLPPNWYLAIRQTAGTGLQVVSAFDQTIN